MLYCTDNVSNRAIDHTITASRSPDMRIEYPVALDSDYAVWSAFGNHYWPAPDVRPIGNTEAGR
jgi:hypothetical protein